MQYSNSIHRIAAKYLALSGLMDERMSRQRAAAEATAYGWGGVRAVSRAIGMSPHTRGLTIQAELDRRSYPTGIKVSDDELAAVNITPGEFHGEWNYCIRSARRKM
jgi:hypothetical protein